MKITSEDLIIIGQFLGYELPIDGICCGFIHMWTQAVFTQEEVHFYNRLRILEPFHNRLLNLHSLLNDTTLTSIEKREQLKVQLSTNTHYLSELKNLMQNAQEAPQKSETDVLYLELHAFFNALKLYHIPSSHPEYFPENKFVLQNDFAEIFSLVKPQRLQDKNPHLLLDKYHCFTQQKMKAFFDKLKCTAIEFPQVMVIHLRTTSHQVGIKYDSAQNIWHYMDIEDFKRYPEHEEYYGELETRDLIMAIFQSLPASSSLPLQLQVWSIESENLKLKAQLANLDDEFSITDELQDGIDEAGNNLLHLASMNGKMEVIQAIRCQKLQCWLNQPTRNQMTPLIYACQNGHFDVALSLLAPEFQSNLDYANDVGTTALLAATEYGHEQIVEELIKPQYQVNIAATDSLGKNVLHWACGLGNVSLVKKLLMVTSAVQLNQKDCKGRTPLYFAGWNELNPEVLPLLLAHGANPKLVDNSGSSVLDRAVRMKKTIIISTLLQCAHDHHLLLNELCTSNTLRRILHSHFNKEELRLLQSILNDKELVQLVDIQYQLKVRSIAPNQFFAPSKITLAGIAGILAHIRKKPQSKLTELCVTLGWINEEKQWVEGHPAIVLYKQGFSANKDDVQLKHNNFKK